MIDGTSNLCWESKGMWTTEDEDVLRVVYLDQATA